MDVYIKYLSIRWRWVVYTNAADCGSDFLPAVSDSF